MTHLFNANFFIIPGKCTIDKSDCCWVKLHGQQPTLSAVHTVQKRPHGAGQKNKNQTAEWLHTSTSFRLIIQINTSLFIK